MWNTGLDEAQAGIKIAGRDTNNLRYAAGVTLMAESEEEKTDLKLSLQKTKIVASCPITSWQIEGTGGSNDKFYFLGLQNDCGWWLCHEIKRTLLLEGKLWQTSVQFSSVAQLCPTLCDPTDCSMPGLPVHHQLLEFTQTHVHWVSDAIQPITSSFFPLFSCPQSFPASGSFLMSQFFASGGQSIGISASASVLPMKIQDWFPLGWAGCISLQSKGLSRVYSNTTIQKHQFFGTQLSI